MASMQCLEPASNQEQLHMSHDSQQHQQQEQTHFSDQVTKSQTDSLCQPKPHLIAQAHAGNGAAVTGKKEMKANDIKKDKKEKKEKKEKKSENKDKKEKKSENKESENKKKDKKKKKKKDSDSE